MEIENKKTGIDMKMLLKIAMLLAIIIAIVMQVKVTKMIIQKEEVLNSEPLSYGARKYGIYDCTCYLSENKQIWFNQSTSITKIQQKSNALNTFKLNLSSLQT